MKINMHGNAVHILNNKLDSNLQLVYCICNNAIRNTAMTTKLEQFEENFADAKHQYLAIMAGGNDAAVLFKWIAENNINEWGIFHHGANQCSTLEGWIGMYHTLHHALYDDGEVTFVKTAFQGPRIVFFWKNEDYFEDLYYKNVDKHLKPSFKIIGFLDNVRDFIAEYTKHEESRAKQFDKIEKLRKNIHQKDNVNV